MQTGGIQQQEYLILQAKFFFPFLKQKFLFCNGSNTVVHVTVSYFRFQNFDGYIFNPEKYVYLTLKQYAITI